MCAVHRVPPILFYFSGGEKRRGGLKVAWRVEGGMVHFFARIRDTRMV